MATKPPERIRKLGIDRMPLPKGRRPFDPIAYVSNIQITDGVKAEKIVSYLKGSSKLKLLSLASDLQIKEAHYMSELALNATIIGRLALALHPASFDESRHTEGKRGFIEYTAKLLCPKMVQRGEFVKRAVYAFHRDSAMQISIIQKTFDEIARSILKDEKSRMAEFYASADKFDFRKDAESSVWHAA